MFDEFRAIQAKKKSDEERKAQEAKAEADLASKKAALDKQMSDMKLGQYQPKYGQDKQMFDQMYLDYVNRLNSDSGNSTDTNSEIAPSTPSERPYSQQSSVQSVYDDRNDN